MLIREPGQAVELLSDPEAADPVRILSAPLLGDLSEVTDLGVLYSIELPDGLVVRPADWRRIVHDHSAVAKLVGATVRHNCNLIDLELLTPELMRQTEVDLHIALGDLSSVFDVESVLCAISHGDLLEVTVSGKHKDGERTSIALQVPGHC